jgi:hypothetical protein
MKSLKSVFTAILFVASLATLQSCADNIVTDTLTDNGNKLEYTYSGDLSGTFKVNGAFPSQTSGSGAKSSLSTDRKTVTFQGVTWTNGGSKADFITITLNSKDPVVDNQVFTFGNSNSQATIISGYGVAYPDYDPTEAFGAVSATVTLTSAKENQLKGTFEATTVNPSGKIVTITAGKLDMKY